MRPVARPLLLLGALTILASSLVAHGGQYRGPGNVAPPPTPTGGSTSSSSSGGNNSNSGGSGNTNGGTGAATGPTTPAPNSSPTRVGAGARGASLDDDLGRWEFWWEFGKDPWLRLRDAIYDGSRGGDGDALLTRRLVPPRANVLRPQDKDLDQVAAALAMTLQHARDRDTISSCIVALAKIGRSSASWQLRELFVPWLQNGDQELRETAALAFGIAGQLEAANVELVLALVQDLPEGRRVSGGHPVNERTRAFAAFASGLLLARCDKPAVAHQLVGPLLDIVDRPRAHGRDLTVAAIEALALFPRSAPGTAAAVMRTTIVDKLGRYYELQLGPGDHLLQAHVPPAVARLLRADDPAVTEWKARLLADLRAGIDTQKGSHQHRGANLFIAQSAAVALGGLAGPWNADTDTDAGIGAALLDVYRHHRDQQTRSFALLALARMGGQRTREVLLRELALAGRAIEQPWCAMALGVLQARAIEADTAASRSSAPDAALTKALEAAFATARNPSSQGALAVAIGLAGEADGADRLRAALAEHRQRDDVVGYVALGLGLLRDPRAIAELRDLLRASTYRPFVMMQAVRALGLIGDQSVADLLCAELQAPNASLVKLAAVASALGQIGDRRSLAPLLQLLGSADQPPLTRAFAAVALGSICDKEALPWNSVFATNTNYRAATETLTDGGSGILDIL